MQVILETERNREIGLNETVRMVLHLPPSFPPKYVKAVLRSMDLCAVKRHLVEPPSIEIVAQLES